MRQVVLDTETTGLWVAKGHRVVEIGCIELIERRVTGRFFQTYLDPQRLMDVEASQVTGITDESLKGKPRFEEIADEFLAFINGAELIIHNAEFDIGFLDAELALTGRGYPAIRAQCEVIDSLVLARERFPGQRNNLDALCRRLQVDNSHRTVHGARLDAELLAEVYLNLTAGQGDLGFDLATTTTAPVSERVADSGRVSQPGSLPVRRANAEEAQAHQDRLAQMTARGACLWPPETA